MKWLKHYSNASDDEFISELEDIFGLEGYARWWKLLETIAKQMDETDRCYAEYSWPKWQSFLKGKRNKLETFLVHCQNKRKINLQQNGNILKIFCPKLLELRDNHTKNLQATDKSLASKTKDKEEDKEVIYSAGAKTDFEKVMDVGLELFPDLAIQNSSIIHQWIGSDCDPELDIIPEIRRCAGKSIQAWSYFTKAISAAKATRTTPMPEGKPRQTAPPWRAGEVTTEQQRELLDQVYGNAS